MVRKIEKFSEKLTAYPKDEKEQILKAAHWAEKRHRKQFRASGEPYFIHPLQVAEILVDLQLDSQSIIASLLHDILEDTDITRQQMRKDFGKEVESLVNGVTKISILRAKNKTVQEAETIRKMLFAMVKDIRVIIIKLADKIHNMRTLEYLPESKRKNIAKECLDIYAPLAGRLGISWAKDELQDLALKHLHPDYYDQIKEFVSQKKIERSDYLLRVENAILEAARTDGFEVEVATRAKHFYSIYLKMKRKGKKLDEIYDLLGIRVLCSNQNECYSILGIVHRLWIPIEGRFKDYIAMPKANRYQSLHTTVLCYEGKLIEIQIRTRDMHNTAEFGVAAHWFYKNQVRDPNKKSTDLTIINKLKSWNNVKITSRDFLEEIKGELLKDSIYVFTPQGDAIELPNGSTAIDFAYHIHTEVGNHCIGAKADGAIIPLKEELKNTQVIEILTSQKATPHVNWLRHVKTARARSKIRGWLNKHDENLIIDRNIVARKNNKEVQQEVPAERLQPPIREEEIPPTQNFRDPTKVAIKIGNERNLMINLAGCCNPSTGDDIVGYISRGRGIIVHKKGCQNLQFINGIKERTIDVEWETVSPRATRKYKVTARKTSDLFSEIEGAVRKYRGHLIEGKVDENEQGNLAGFFTMELDKKDDFKRVVKNIRAIPSVMNIYEVVSQI